MVSGHTGNVMPRKGLRVRAPCPPLIDEGVFASAECIEFVLVAFLRSHKLCYF